MFTFAFVNAKVMRNKHKLLIEQLDNKLKPFIESKNSLTPEQAWIHTIRTTLNMTLQQLGNKLNMTSQGAKRIEEREASGSISIKALKEVAVALDMQLVYALVPKQNSIKDMVDTKANELAKKIVLRTGHNMQLENQAISDDKIKTAIEELAEDIKREMRRSLWD